MLTEKKKVPPMLARIKKRKLKKEDIFKFGTREEIKFLKEIMDWSPEQKEGFKYLAKKATDNRFSQKAILDKLREYIKTARALDGSGGLENELKHWGSWNRLARYVKNIPKMEEESDYSFEEIENDLREIRDELAEVTKRKIGKSWSVVNKKIRQDFSDL